MEITKKVIQSFQWTSNTKELADNLYQKLISDMSRLDKLLRACTEASTLDEFYNDDYDHFMQFLADNEWSGFENKFFGYSSVQDVDGVVHDFAQQMNFSLFQKIAEGSETMILSAIPEVGTAYPITVNVDEIIQHLTDVKSNLIAQIAIMKSVSLSNSPRDIFDSLPSVYSNLGFKDIQNNQLVSIFMSNINNDTNNEDVLNAVNQIMVDGNQLEEDDTENDISLKILRSLDGYTNASPFDLMVDDLAQVDWTGIIGTITNGAIVLLNWLKNSIEKAVEWTAGKIIKGYNYTFNPTFMVENDSNLDKSDGTLFESSNLYKFPLSDIDLLKGLFHSTSPLFHILVTERGLAIQDFKDYFAQLREFSIPGMKIYAKVVADDLLIMYRLKPLSTSADYYYNGFPFGQPENQTMFLNNLSNILSLGFNGKVYNYSPLNGALQEITGFSETEIAAKALYNGSHLARTSLVMAAATDSIVVNENIIEANWLSIASHDSNDEKEFWLPENNVNVLNALESLNILKNYANTSPSLTCSIDSDDVYTVNFDFSSLTNNHAMNELRQMHSTTVSMYLLVHYLVQNFSNETLFVPQRRINTFPVSTWRLLTSSDVKKRVNNLYKIVGLTVAFAVTTIIGIKTIRHLKSKSAVRTAAYWNGLSQFSKGEISENDLRKLYSKSLRADNLLSSFGLGGVGSTRSGVIDGASSLLKTNQDVLEKLEI